MRLLALSGSVVLALGMVAAVSAAQTARATLLAAHRGGSLLWPENSLLAFKNALALGADFIEFDVHLSRDGEVVVIHDATLDRTTTGTGSVRDRTLAELKTLRLKDRSGTVSQEPVPTLDEVAAVAAGPAWSTTRRCGTRQWRSVASTPRMSSGRTTSTSCRRSSLSPRRRACRGAGSGLPKEAS